jgi:hypothetical protein
MAKRKRLDDDAEQVAVYLTPTEKLVLDVIAGRRKKRREERTSPSEIVADALWKVLAESENIAKEKIQELLAVPSGVAEEPNNVKVFPKK